MGLYPYAEHPTKPHVGVGPPARDDRLGGQYAADARTPPTCAAQHCDMPRGQGAQVGIGDEQHVRGAPNSGEARLARAALSVPLEHEHRLVAHAGAARAAEELPDGAARGRQAQLDLYDGRLHRHILRGRLAYGRREAALVKLVCARVPEWRCRRGRISARLRPGHRVAGGHWHVPPDARARRSLALRARERGLAWQHRVERGDARA